MSFMEVFPNTTDAHFVYAPNSGEVPIVNTTSVAANIATFLQNEMRVSRVATGRFRTDITEDRDDILVAIFSLLFLLCTHAIVTSTLLRAGPGGRVSNHAFSLTQFLHLVRDFRMRHLFHGRGRVAKRMPVDAHLVVVAMVLLLVTFSAEFLILFFSSPELVPVTNEIASISLAQPVAPEWDLVRKTSRTTMNPCSVILLSGVEQRSTRITTCLTANLPQFEAESFVNKYEDDANPLKINITSDLHEYGTMHFITVGDVAAEYSAMAYYTLNDGKGRIAPDRILRGNRLPGMRYVHNVLIAFIFSTYKHDTGDSRVTTELLTKLDINTQNTAGPDVDVIKINNVEKFVRVVSDRYTTTVMAPPIAAVPVLSFSRAVLKSIISVRVTGPDTKDLLMGSGARTESVAVVWYESSRTLNWLTLILLLAGALLVLFWVRFSLHSVSVADIAGLLVNKVVLADKERSPVEMEESENRTFYIGVIHNGSDYQYGAETSDEQWNRVEGNYDDMPPM